MNRLYQHYIVLVILIVSLFLGCKETDYSQLSNYRYPGQVLGIERCVKDDVWVESTQCSSGESIHYVYVANMLDGSVAVGLYGKSEIEVQDVNRSVPGVSSIRVNDRPEHMSLSSNAAILVVGSTVNSDVSIVSTEDSHEIGFQKLDKPVVHFISDGNAFWAFMLDGEIRRMEVKYNCGKGEGVYVSGCGLNKDKIEVDWQRIGELDGKIGSVIKSTKSKRAFVSFVNRRYVSEVSFAQEAGKCLKGEIYPCESRRIGVGFGCEDGLDNDGDGKLDEEDLKCFGSGSREGIAGVGYIGKHECNDGIDNDDDGVFDAYDVGCESSKDVEEKEGVQEAKVGSCGDGIDNDGDGFVDRDDASCLYVMGEESSKKSERFGLCSDGVDNDGDLVIDSKDLGCYGRYGFSESEGRKGNGSLGLDPEDKWLYVLNPEGSEVIIVDLEAGETVSLEGYNPRHTGVGVHVGLIPLAVVGDRRESVIFELGADKVVVEESGAYVSTASGEINHIVAGMRYKHMRGEELVKEVFVPVFRHRNESSEASYISSARCINRICSERDIPQIDLRRRSWVQYNESASLLLSDKKAGGERVFRIADELMQTDTWRLIYGGSLENVIRSDGRFVKDGVFKSDRDFCSLGVREGDILVVKDVKSIRDGQDCDGYKAVMSRDVERGLRWKVKSLDAEHLFLESTGKEGDPEGIPMASCFVNAFRYEVRVAEEWVLSSRQTNVQSRQRVGLQCVDNGKTRYGQIRMKTGEILRGAFFDLKLPDGVESFKEGSGFEFVLRSGFRRFYIPSGNAVSALSILKSEDRHWLVVSDTGVNRVYVHDIESLKR